MKAKLYIPILLLLSFILTGCPYESEVPIDSPQVEVNKNLIGKWIEQKDNKENKENPEYLEIKKVGEKKYLIEQYSWESHNYKVDKYFMHVSLIGDLQFMNIQKEKGTKYYLYKFLLKGNTLTFFEITDNIDEKFNDSKELKAFIKKYMNLSFFYSKEEEVYLKEEK